MSEMQQKDLVLSPNEYAYVLDETKGNVACNVGPHKMSLSQSDKLVKFDSYAKRFTPCERYKDAIQLFTTAPEGWYIALKNPAPSNKHPSAGTSNTIPENMQIGYKVNIPGPVSFALYPGQMAQVIKGHTLRSNQYLVARVYDADSLNQTKEERGEPDHEDYINGQILIIKGTEISFYIPPTGIEVKAIENDSGRGYVRDAVTLERLEYCILKDEDGNKRYVHGPEVVFPSPTESFIQDGNKNIKRNAIELSDISGVYVKVIADYKDETGEHKTGEELFITGKDQMIYYPRPEHNFISYDGRILHHAIAIPKGEGRYILNRMTGEIKTVRGPAMYLSDPRTEVAVERKLSRSQCELWYPGNEEVLEANGHGRSLEKGSMRFATANAVATFADSTMYTAVETGYNGTPMKQETNKINRSNTYTPPRTISLGDSKYKGAVAVDVWTGYAVNVISKDGTRRVVLGPQTILLDYDQTLEMLELSTGKPKTTDNLERVVFLRYENNQVSDIVNVETADFVRANVKLSYHVNFDTAVSDKWFSVDNYVKHMCDWARNVIKNEAKKHTLADFHDNYYDIVLSAISTEDDGTLHRFNENGMVIVSAEVLSLALDSNVQRLINEHQEQLVSRSLDLVAAQQSAETEAQIIELNREKVELAEQYARFKADQAAETAAQQHAIRVSQQKLKDEEESRQAQVEKDIQALRKAIFDAEQERTELERKANIEYKRALLNLDIEREAKSAEAMKTVLEAIGPELAAALNNENNQEIVAKIAESVAPYAVANGESVSTAVTRLTRGTALEDVLGKMMAKQ